MQDSARGSEQPVRPFNPLLDFAIAGLEAQLKAWQTYQEEGTRFVAKRLRSNLEHLRALGHCCDAHSIGECQKAWLNEIQKDYAEECGRITATAFAIGFGDLAGLGWLFGQRTAKDSPQVRSGGPERSTPPLASRPGFPAAA